MVGMAALNSLGLVREYAMNVMLKEKATPMEKKTSFFLYKNVLRNDYEEICCQMSANFDMAKCCYEIC